MGLRVAGMDVENVLLAKVVPESERHFDGLVHTYFFSARLEIKRNAFVCIHGSDFIVFFKVFDGS